ncbi:MAG: thioredoxin fold domain-containing protein [Nevskia sp.]|nr:thioredoxin fold domain-containing protein [Nevskia sp.]
MKRILLAVCGLALAFGAGVLAADDAGAAAVKDKLAKALGVAPENIRPAAAPGLLEVIRDHDFAYVTADGKWLLRGELINVDTGEHVTENSRRADRLAALKQLGAANLIEFAPAPPAVARYTVTVFTDIDCPYCRKLHSQIADYNARGIAVRYAFFPRTGLNTPSYDKAVSVWCADDRRKAFTLAKRGEPIPRKLCDNPVAREFQLGVELGVQGTPMIYLPDGDVIPGYATPDDLLAALQENEQQTKTAAAALKPPG